MYKYIIILLLAVSNLYPQVKYELNCNEDLLNTSHKIALSQIGVREKTNRNDGKEVEAYLKSVYLAKGNPYCAAGQYWSFFEASKRLNLSLKSIPIKRTGSTYQMFNEAMKIGNKVTFKAEKNDLLFWVLTTTGHVERIDTVLKAGWVMTVGFNTSAGTASQSEGEGVYYRKRNIYTPLSRMRVRGLIGFNTN